MIFNHDTMVKTSGSFRFTGNIQAKANPAVINPTIQDLWFGHTFRSSKITFENTDELLVKLGNADRLDPNGQAYAINVTPTGVTVSASNEKDLIRGFITLMDLIEMSPDGEHLEIPCCEIKESPSVKIRMIHYCVFHSSELWQIERFVKFCGALKYTHIIMEFWGMYKYHCLEELSWPEGYTKEQLAPIIKSAKELGLEFVPFINHFGHAPQARVAYGKHVVLNQNPSLQYLFSEDGWCWDIKNPKTRNLLKEMRKELCELFGNGDYFHIGCDEAYGFDFSKESMSEICEYLNHLAEEIKEESGRRTILWGDMFLSSHEEFVHDMYQTNSPTLEAEQFMQQALDKNIIVADWQYAVRKYPVETSITLKNAGFDTILCPQHDPANLSSSFETVLKAGLFGYMVTTWDLLTTKTPSILHAAQMFWTQNPSKYFGISELSPFAADELRCKTAACLRKVHFTPEYEKAGWIKSEIDHS